MKPTASHAWITVRGRRGAGPGRRPRRLLCGARMAADPKRWRVPIEGVPYGVAVTAGLVIVGTTTGTLYAIGSMSGIEE
jgi:hypothetical protein